MKADLCEFFPRPDLLQADHLLCIQPHPDDLEIGAGATIARLSRAGLKVTWLTVTDGSAGTYDQSVSRSHLALNRRGETEKAAAILGVDALLWLDYPDGGNLPYEEIRSKITRTIRKFKPSAVLVCDPWLPYEAHSDHIRTGRAGAEAAFLSGMPYFCPENLEEGLEPYKINTVAFYFSAYPNTFIDASAYWDLKLAAIDCHASQFPAEKGKLLKEYLTARAREQAQNQNCSLAEAFKVLSPHHLHIFETAWKC